MQAAATLHEDERPRRFGDRWKLGISPWQFMKELLHEIKEDDIFMGAAALGYYLTLAIFPAAIFTMALLPYLPIPHVDEAIMGLLREGMPPGASDMFLSVVHQVTDHPRGGLLSFGFLATLWATSTGMNAVIQELNVTYDVDEARGFVRSRLMAIGLSLLFVALVIGGFSLIVLGGLMHDWLAHYVGHGSPVLVVFAIFRWLVIVAVMLLAFALVYYLGPSVKQEFAFITPGSVVGVTLLILASLGFAWYVQHFGNYDATYGSIGAVIVLMLWLYLTGLAILFGSEINALIEHHAPGGKVKGERVRGERERNPTTRRRAEEAAPEHKV
jgi:membrane protein